MHPLDVYLCDCQLSMHSVLANHWQKFHVAIHVCLVCSHSYSLVYCMQPNIKLILTNLCLAINRMVQKKQTPDLFLI